MDRIGTSGPDLFDDAPEGERFLGLGGLDVVRLATPSTSHGLARDPAGSETWVLTGAVRNEFDDIERLFFTDTRIALDTAAGQPAGQALLGEGVLLPASARGPATMGLLLGLIDSGIDLQTVFQLGVDLGVVAALAGSGQPADIVRMAWRNVVGSEAPALMVDALSAMMDGRLSSMTPAQFLNAVAQLEINQVQVDLVGAWAYGAPYL